MKKLRNVACSKICIPYNDTRGKLYHIARNSANDPALILLFLSLVNNIV